MNEQVTTELDFMKTVYQYITEQLDGRFRLEYPEGLETIDHMITDLKYASQIGTDADDMKLALIRVGQNFAQLLFVCSMKDCPETKQHAFIREYMELILNARRFTSEWLKGKGIVPGQSWN